MSNQQKPNKQQLEKMRKQKESNKDSGTVIRKEHGKDSNIQKQ
jgi:hypothetical protein